MWICWVVLHTVAHSLWSPVNGWNACQEPLRLNTKLDLADKISWCWCPVVLLMGIHACEYLQWTLAFTSVGCRIVVIVKSACFFAFSVRNGRGRFALVFVMTQWLRQHWHHELHYELHDPPGAICSFGKWGLEAGGRGLIKTGRSKNSKDLVQNGSHLLCFELLTVMQSFFKKKKKLDAWGVNSA